MTVLFRICKKTNNGEFSIAIYDSFDTTDLRNVRKGRRMQSTVGRTEDFNRNALAGNPWEVTNTGSRIENAMNMITAKTGRNSRSLAGL